MSEEKVVVVPTHLSDTAQDKLKQFVDRIERTEKEKADVQAAIKDIYAEARALGFDSKALRALIKSRKKSRQERETEEAILDLYMHAIGEA